MAQIEHPDNLARFANPAYRLVTLILIRCGLRVTDALSLPRDCVVLDADGAPYLRYLNHKMKREALVPIDEQLHALIAEQQPADAGRRTPGAVPAADEEPRRPHPTASRPTGWRSIAGWPAAMSVTRTASRSS